MTIRHMTDTTYVVCDVATTDELVGAPSAELAEASLALATGAVAACRDNAGIWQLVRDDEVDDWRAMGEDVVIVYILEVGAYD